MAKKHKSKALMVHPDQAARFEEKAQSLGVDVEYDRKTGECQGSAKALEFEAARRGYYNSRGTNDKALKIYEDHIKHLEQRS